MVPVMWVRGVLMPELWCRLEGGLVPVAWDRGGLVPVVWVRGVLVPVVCVRGGVPVVWDREVLVPPEGFWCLWCGTEG